MEKSEMRGLQFLQQIADFILKIGRRIRRFNQWPMPLHCGLPVSIQLFRRIEALLQRRENAIEHFLSLISRESCGQLSFILGSTWNHLFSWWSNSDWIC